MRKYHDFKHLNLNSQAIWSSPGTVTAIGPGLRLDFYLEGIVCRVGSIRCLNCDVGQCSKSPYIKRMIFLLLCIAFLGVSITAGFVYFQTSRLGFEIETKAQLSFRAAKSAAKIQDSFRDLQSKVSLSFLSGSIPEIEAFESQIQSLIAELKSEIQRAENIDYEDLGLESLNFVESNETKTLATEEFLKKFHDRSIELFAATDSLLNLRKTSIATQKELQKTRSDLSKSYRASHGLAKYNSELYAQIGRAAATALSSQAVRDLNFAGRGIFEKAQPEFAKLKLSSSDRELFNTLTRDINSALDLSIKVYSGNGDFDVFNQQISSIAQSADYLQKELQNRLEETQSGLTDKANFTKSSTILAAIVTLFACAGGGFLVSRSLINTLSKVINSLGRSGQNVLFASQDLTGTSEVLSTGAQKGASYLEETLASLTEVSSMVNSTFENAKAGALLARNTSQLAESGKKEVAKLIESMRGLSEQSKKIEEITKVIEDIAFQTNLLALNAAVEAARAGEQGKGFAVVADAVRALAQRSSLSAKNISELIATSVKNANQGAAVADASDQALQKIVDAVTELAQKSEAIVQAGDQQNQGLSQIQKALTELSAVSQNTANSAKTTTSSSELLSRQSTDLKQLVDELQDFVGAVGESDKAEAA